MLLSYQNLLIAFYFDENSKQSLSPGYRALWYLTPVYLFNVISFTLALTYQAPDLLIFLVLHKGILFAPTVGRGELCISLSADFSKICFLIPMEYLLMGLFLRDFFLTNKSRLLIFPNNILSYDTFIFSSAHIIILKLFICLCIYFFFILPTRQRKLPSLELFLPFSSTHSYLC